MTNEQRAIATEMRHAGVTYDKIGESIGVHRETVRRWLNPNIAHREKSRRDTPEYRSQKRAYQRELMNDPEYRKLERERGRRRRDDPEYRKWQQKYAESLEHRCQIALNHSRHQAKKHNHISCNATVAELIDAFDGHCDGCGIAESVCKTRLCMDHDHTSGNFRGWLCLSCNTSIGHAHESAAQLRTLASYLDQHYVRTSHAVCQPSSARIPLGA